MASTTAREPLDPIKALEELRHEVKMLKLSMQLLTVSTRSAFKNHSRIQHGNREQQSTNGRTVQFRERVEDDS